MPKLLGLSQRAFAKLEGVSHTLVQRRIKSGHLEAYPDGSISPDLAGTGWHAALEDKVEAIVDATPDDAIPPKAVSEARKEHYLSLLRQLEYDREVGKVVLIEDSCSVLTKRFHAVRTKLLSLPARLAPLMIGVKTAPEAFGKLQDGVHEILWELNDAAMRHVQPDMLSPADRIKYDELIDRKERERNRNALMPEEAI